MVTNVLSILKANTMDELLASFAGTVDRAQAGYATVICGIAIMASGVALITSSLRVAFPVMVVTVGFDFFLGIFALAAREGVTSTGTEALVYALGKGYGLFLVDVFLSSRESLLAKGAGILLLVIGLNESCPMIMQRLM